MSINRWMDKEEVVQVYNGILLSHKKEQKLTFAATWMQLEIIILSEVSQKEKDKYHMISFICGIKIWHKWTYLQNRNRLTDIEIRLVVAKWEGGRRGMDWEFGVVRCKLLHLEWTNNKVLLYNTEKFIQSAWINYNGK